MEKEQLDAEKFISILNPEVLNKILKVKSSQNTGIHQLKSQTISLFNFFEVLKDDLMKAGNMPRGDFKTDEDYLQAVASVLKNAVKEIEPLSTDLDSEVEVNLNLFTRANNYMHGISNDLNSLVSPIETNSEIVFNNIEKFNATFSACDTKLNELASALKTIKEDENTTAILHNNIENISDGFSSVNRLQEMVAENCEDKQVAAETFSIYAHEVLDKIKQLTSGFKDLATKTKNIQTMEQNFNKNILNFAKNIDVIVERAMAQSISHQNQPTNQAPPQIQPINQATPQSQFGFSLEEYKKLLAEKKVKAIMEKSAKGTPPSVIFEISGKNYKKNPDPTSDVYIIPAENDAELNDSLNSKQYSAQTLATEPTDSQDAINDSFAEQSQNNNSKSQNKFNFSNPVFAPDFENNKTYGNDTKTPIKAHPQNAIKAKEYTEIIKNYANQHGLTAHLSELLKNKELGQLSEAAFNKAFANAINAEDLNAENEKQTASATKNLPEQPNLNPEAKAANTNELKDNIPPINQRNFFEDFQQSRVLANELIRSKNFENINDFSVESAERTESELEDSFEQIRKNTLNASDLAHNETFSTAFNASASVNSSVESHNENNGAPEISGAKVSSAKIVLIDNRNRKYVVNKRLSEIEINPAKNLIKIGAMKFTIGPQLDDIREVEFFSDNNMISKLSFARTLAQNPQNVPNIEKAQGNQNDSQPGVILNDSASQNASETSTPASPDKQATKNTNQNAESQESSSDANSSEKAKEEKGKHDLPTQGIPAANKTEASTKANNTAEISPSAAPATKYRDPYLEKIDADYNSAKKDFNKNFGGATAAAIKLGSALVLIGAATGALPALPLLAVGAAAGGFLFSDTIIDPILKGTFTKTKAGLSWIRNKYRYVNALVFNPKKANMLKRFSKEQNMTEYYRVLNSKTNPYKKSNLNKENEMVYSKPTSAQQNKKGAYAANAPTEIIPTQAQQPTEKFSIKTPLDFETLTREEKKEFLSKYTNHPERYRPNLINKILGKEPPKELRLTRTDLAMRDLEEKMTEAEKLATLSDAYINSINGKTDAGLQRKFSIDSPAARKTEAPKSDTGGIVFKDTEPLTGAQPHDPHSYTNKQATKGTEPTNRSTKTPANPYEHNGTKSPVEKSPTGTKSKDIEMGM